MARREVIEISCDRCKRIETQGKTKEDIPRPEFTITLRGKTTSYEDLCKRCRDTLANCYSSATKAKEEGAKPPLKVAPEPPKRNRLLGRS